MTATPNLGIDYLESNEPNAHVTVNTAFNVLDAYAGLSVLARQNAPPGSPTDGDVYIVGDTGTGSWASQDEKLAAYYDGWKFYNPSEGMIFFDQDAGLYLRYNGSTWKTFSFTTAAFAARSTDGGGAQSIANGTTFIKVANTCLDEELLDPSSYYDLATARYTPLVAGHYEFGALLMMTGIDDGTDVELVVKKNGSENHFISVAMASSGSSVLSVGGTTVIAANGTTDYFELFTRHGSAGSRTTFLPGSGTVYGSNFNAKLLLAT